MTEQTYALNAPCELVIDLTATAEETASLTFYKIPRLAMDQVGDVCIDWGDGVLEYIDCTLSEVELQRMARDATFTPVLRVAHRGLAEAVTRIRIRTTSGFLPLRALAHQTYAIVSPLPTLTVGQTDKNGKLLPTKRLLPLIEPDESGKTALTFVAGDLFINNPNLAVLDCAFYASRIRTVDAHLFDAIENPVSIREIFARSDLEVLPEGLLSHVGPNTVCTRAFADCHALKEVSDPFAGAPVPFVVDAFLQGAPHTAFAWADPARRAQMGWVRPKAGPDDPAFRFVYKADGSNEFVLAFYETDLALPGDFWIEWGDGSSERIDFDGPATICHRWEKSGLYTVLIHWTAPYPVRPFRFFDSLVQILDPLPPMHLKALGVRGDYCGWAAGFENLTELPAGLFRNNSDITNLEQCFAGCVALTSVPDDIVSDCPKLVCADAMFAFCYKLKRLPASYARLARRLDLDCFCEESEEESA